MCASKKVKLLEIAYPTQNDFHQLRLTVLLETLYSVQTSYYTLHFTNPAIYTLTNSYNTLVSQNTAF